MKAKEQMYVTLLTAVILLPCWSVAEESPAAQEARNFLEQALGITVTTIVEKPSVTYDVIGLPYRLLTADATYDVWVSENASAIYGYARRGMFVNENLEGKTTADAISEDRAFATIVPVLNYLDLSTAKSDYHIDFQDMGGGAGNSLEGCFWSVSREMALNEKPCRTRTFIGVVAAASETVYIVRYSPSIPPENQLNVVITYQAARQAAQDWLAEEPYFTVASPILLDDDGEGEQVIAPQQNFFAIDEEEQTSPTATYYSWEIPFEWTEWGDAQFNGVVWVDIETGEVVGAGSNE